MSHKNKTDEGKMYKAALLKLMENYTKKGHATHQIN